MGKGGTFVLLKQHISRFESSTSDSDTDRHQGLLCSIVITFSCLGYCKARTV